MRDTVVAAPLRIEAALVSSAARGAVVRKTGMGPGKARAAAERLRAEPASALLVLGFCGGLDAESVPGEVIIPTEVYAAEDEGHAPARLSCDLAGELLTRLGGRGLKLRSGSL